MLSAATSRRIAPIVAGCLTSGLVAAIVLVAFPFAGAEEHVITGTVLIAFAFGWALLAVLSVRSTDQPQRWAAGPAACMALVGAGLLILAPGDQVLTASGWVWPPLLLVLVVWMTVQARRHLRSRTRAWLLYPVFAVLALAALGGGYETVRASIDRGAYGMPGQLVDVGGHRLHIHCTGSGSPTVVLEPGLGEPSSTMSGWIAPALARNTRVCAYDRAGQGWSEAASGSHDGVEVATDLHTLLDRAHIDGPYVLVGHSLGGIYALVFAHRYPDQVAGMVLLDASHPEQFLRLAGFPAFHAVFRRVSALLPSLSRLGIARLVFQPEDGSPPAQARGLRNEVGELPIALGQAGELQNLGDRPLAVVTAADGAQAGWLPLQDDLAALSTSSVHRVLPDATHASLIDDKRDAAQSSDAIHDVVESARTTRPLTQP